MPWQPGEGAQAGPGDLRMGTGLHVGGLCIVSEQGGRAATMGGGAGTSCMLRECREPGSTRSGGHQPKALILARVPLCPTTAPGP